MNLDELQNIKHATRLDISIPLLDKHLSVKGTLDDLKVAMFFSNQMEYTEKFDGLKVTIWRNGAEYDPTDYTKNWVFSYKNFVMFPEEFDGEEFGYFKFHHVIDHIKSIHYKCGNIPCNTEFFIEFVTEKSTLRTHYTNIDVLILLGWSKATGSISGGYLHTSPEGFNRDCSMFGVLNMITPPIVNLPRKVSTVSDFKELINDVTKIESILGGKVEGVIVNNQFKILAEVFYKFENLWQPEQHYWKKVNDLGNNIPTSGSLVDRLLKWKRIALNINDQTLTPNDIYVTGRKRILQSLDENQNALIIGRFQPLSIAHEKMIRTAAKNNPTVFVAVVDGALTSRNKTKNPYTYNQRKKMIDGLGMKNVIVIQAPTGNLIAIINRLASGIAKIICGPDRAKSYSSQNVTDVEVVNYDRDEVSSTKIRNALIKSNYEEYCSLTPVHMHGMFKELQHGR